MIFLEEVEHYFSAYQK